MDPEEQIQYWKSKYEAEKRQALGYEPMMEVDNDLNLFIEEEQEFWDYSCGKLNQEGDQLHFPNGINFVPKIFDWLPWGTTPQCLRKGIQPRKTLSGAVELNIAEVEVLRTSQCEKTSSSAVNKLLVKIIMGVKKVIEQDTTLTFTCNMADHCPPHCNNSYRPEDKKNSMCHPSERGVGFNNWCTHPPSSRSEEKCPVTSWRSLSRSTSPRRHEPPHGSFVPSMN
jgi:hypothetical protein